MESDETDLEVDEINLFVYSLEESEEAQSIYSMKTPPLEAGTKWFDKLTILSKVEGPMGFPPRSRGPLLHRGGEAVALPFGRPRGSTPGVDII